MRRVSLDLALVLSIGLLVGALPAWAIDASPGPAGESPAMASTGPEVAAARVSLLIYSGRPDPGWAIDAGQLERLGMLVAGLDAVEGEPPLGGLAYHGFRVEAPTGSWEAFDGAVRSPDAAPGTYLADPERSVERFLLETGLAHLADIEVALAAEALALAPSPEPAWSPGPASSPIIETS